MADGYAGYTHTYPNRCSHKDAITVDPMADASLQCKTAITCLSVHLCDCVADLPKELLEKIVDYNRSNIRSIACVNMMLSSVSKLPQFTKLIQHNPRKPFGGCMSQNITARRQYVKFGEQQMR